ncbi:hypothetical protein [Vibrio parahaemolyticus]
MINKQECFEVITKPGEIKIVFNGKTLVTFDSIEKKFEIKNKLIETIRSKVTRNSVYQKISEIVSENGLPAKYKWADTVILAIEPALHCLKLEPIDLTELAILEKKVILSSTNGLYYLYSNTSASVRIELINLLNSRFENNSDEENELLIGFLIVNDAKIAHRLIYGQSLKTGIIPKFKEDQFNQEFESLSSQVRENLNISSIEPHFENAEQIVKYYQEEYLAHFK